MEDVLGPQSGRKERFEKEEEEEEEIEKKTKRWLMLQGTRGSVPEQRGNKTVITTKDELENGRQECLVF